MIFNNSQVIVQVFYLHYQVKSISLFFSLFFRYLCYIQYTPSFIQSITQYFFSISSWVKKSFYLTYLTEAIIRSSYPIPQEDTIMQSILLSFNSILYRIAIRFFALKPRLFCNQLLLLSQEQQVQVLQFFIQNSYTVLEDVCKSGSPVASSDVYSSDICSMLCNCVRFVSSIKLLDISSVSESIQNIGRYHILLFHVDYFYISHNHIGNDSNLS